MLQYDAPGLAEEQIPQFRDRLGAVLVRSVLYGDVWITLDLDSASELQCEEQTRADPRPVIHVEDVARLHGKSESMIRAVLEVFRTFPCSRVM